MSESSKSKMVFSARLEGAVSLVMEQGAEDWGAQQHLSMLRYLVLACSDKAKLGKDELDARKPGEKLVISVDWDALTTEFHAAGKLAECANFKKRLAEDHEQFKTVAKEVTKYR